MRSGWLLRVVIACWTLAGAGSSSLRAESPADGPPKVTRFFPLSEIKAGQKGVAYTVFEGVEPEPMQVEILGVLKNALGPRRDMILARLHGTKPDYTGIVAGMSGSPVYIDGRLAGALSYRIGQFSKEPIAGITPIEEMLDVRDAAGNSAPENKGPSEIKPMETPVVFSGFNQETLDRFGDKLRAMGLTPVAGLGGTDADAKQPEPLIPGSAVSAIFVRGDLSMAGTCTVTYVDPKRLLACGHPITQNGPISMPMTKAAVVATLPSPMNSFKIVNTTETVGSFTQDRASAILGSFGTPARMIPVEVNVSDESRSKTFHFEVLNDRQLTPTVMLMAVYQTLQGTNVGAAEESYSLTGELDVAHEPKVSLQGIMAPNGLNNGAASAALYVGERFLQVYQNTAELPVMRGIRLQAKALPQRRTATIESAQTSSSEIRAGETVDIDVVLRPYQQQERVVRIPVKMPPTLNPGTVRLVVSDGATLDRLSGQSTLLGVHTMGLADTIAALNETHPNDRVYVTLLNPSAQAVVEAGALPDLPLSMVNALEPLKDNQQMKVTGESAVLLGQSMTEDAITGSIVLHLEVR